VVFQVSQSQLTELNIYDKIIKYKLLTYSILVTPMMYIVCTVLSVFVMTMSNEYTISKYYCISIVFLMK
jgi:hypothetical protein